MQSNGTCHHSQISDIGLGNQDESAFGQPVLEWLAHRLEGLIPPVGPGGKIPPSVDDETTQWVGEEIYRQVEQLVKLIQEASDHQGQGNSMVEQKMKELGDRTLRAMAQVLDRGWGPYRRQVRDESGLLRETWVDIMGMEEFMDDDLIGYIVRQTNAILGGAAKWRRDEAPFWKLAFSIEWRMAFVNHGVRNVVNRHILDEDYREAVNRIANEKKYRYNRSSLFHDKME
jgi:hypothetical protein